MLEIKPYQSAWPTEYAAIATELENALGPLALRIDHIGSTSVPGLGAKDIIDIQITVADLSNEVEDRLIDAGFRLSPHRTDHVPSGDDPSPELWAKRLFNERPGSRRANIHVRVDGNPNQRYPLLFRDYLRTHPRSAQTIELIKRQLVRYHANDVEAYYNIKDPVYDLIWDAAQEWASAIGWTPVRSAGKASNRVKQTGAITMNISDFVSIEEVQRACRELGIRDWSKLTDTSVEPDEARVIQEVVGAEAVEIPLEWFQQGLEVELEHGMQFPDANVTNNHPVLTGKIVLAHLKEMLDYYLRLEVAELEGDLLKAALKDDAAKLARIYERLVSARAKLSAWEAEQLGEV